MINKIKNILRQWLFSEEIKEIQSLRNKLYEVDKICREAYNLAKSISTMLDIGVNIQSTNPHSWAVICIQGKPEYVKFIPLDTKNAKEMIEFLRRFRDSNVTIDAPMFYRNMFNI